MGLNEKCLFQFSGYHKEGHRVVYQMTVVEDTLGEESPSSEAGGVPRT